MARTLRDLRTAIQPRITAGDNDAQIQVWLRELITDKDITDAEYKAWRLNTGTVLARLEARRAILGNKIETEPQNVTAEEQAEFDAISEAITAANTATGLQLANTDERSAWQAMVPNTFTQAEVDALFALSTNQIPRWQTLDVWDAELGEIAQARALP